MGDIQDPALPIFSLLPPPPPPPVVATIIPFLPSAVEPLTKRFSPKLINSILSQIGVEVNGLSHDVTSSSLHATPIPLVPLFEGPGINQYLHSAVS